MSHSPLYYASILLITGTIDMVAEKLAYQSRAVNMAGFYQLYSQPLFFAFLGICGKAFQLLTFLKNYFQRYRKQGGKLHPFKNNATMMANVALLAFCDVTEIACTSLANTMCPVSITQILRGCIIVFVMITGRIFLKKVPLRSQLAGVVSSFVGLILVGISAIMNEENGGSITGIIIGILLTLVAQVFCSFEYVFEEKLMKNFDMDNAFLIGWEGSIGSAAFLVAVLPICDAIKGDDMGSFENLRNSAYMMFSTPWICVLCWTFIITVSLFGYSTLGVTKTLSAAHRALLEALRTGTIWIIMVIIYYCTLDSKPAWGKNPFGERLTLWSILELFGFLCMIFGTIMHNSADFGAAVLRWFGVSNTEVQFCALKDYQQLAQS